MGDHPALFLASPRPRNGDGHSGREKAKETV